MADFGIRPLIPFPALLIEDGSERALVVADLHVGWEINLVDKGIHIPSQIARIQAKLMQVIDASKPSRIIFLGDLKQAIPRISFEEWRSVPQLLEEVQKHVSDVSVVLGNHDGELEPLTPRSIKIFPSGGIAIGEHVGLFHGHAWPSPEVLGCETLVMGHIHPILFFRDKFSFLMMGQVWVKTKCNSSKLAKAYLKYLDVKVAGKPEDAIKERFGVSLMASSVIIMPAFNDLVGGISLNRLDKRLIGPLLGSGSIIISDAELYLLDGTYVGTVKQLQTSAEG